MPKYHFACEGGLWAGCGPITVDLASVQEARTEAVEHLAEMLKGRADLFWEQEEARITVSDDSGLILFSIKLSAVLPPTMRRGLDR